MRMIMKTPSVPLLCNLHVPLVKWTQSLHQIKWPNDMQPLIMVWFLKIPEFSLKHLLVAEAASFV
jgi:hypothetical protein